MEKELGFDEPLKIYNELESLGFFEWLSETHNLKDTDMKPAYLDELPLNDIHRTVCNSMALRWFREKYGYGISVDRITKDKYKFEINLLFVEDIDYHFMDFYFDCYEEAELACLIKLIELVKKK